MNRQFLILLVNLFAFLVCTSLYATEITRPEVIQVEVDYPQIVTVGSTIPINIQVHSVDVAGSGANTNEFSEIAGEADFTVEITSEFSANVSSIEPHNPIMAEALSSGKALGHQYSYTFNKLNPVHLSYQIKYAHPKRKDVKLISIYYIPNESGELIVTDAKTYQDYVSAKAHDAITSPLELQPSVAMEESEIKIDSEKIQKRMQLPPGSLSLKSNAILLEEVATEESRQMKINIMQETENMVHENE